MFSASLRRTLSGLLAAAQLFPTLALASYECTTTTTSSSGGTGLGSVFSVIGDGTIHIGNPSDTTGACNVMFLNGQTVNARAGNFGAQGSANHPCQDPLSTATDKTVHASGNSASARTLADFLSSTSNTDITADGKDQTIGSGEYGTVTMQNGGTVTISGSARIKSLVLSSCNGKALTIAPGTYFIDSVSWQAQCNLVVSDGSGTAVLNVKNGFDLAGGRTCVNFSSCDSVPASTIAANAAIFDTQKPDRLQFNIYNGDFTTQGNVRIAAGIYVANGKFDSRNGSPTILVGEVLANSIETQNNSDSYFYSKQSSMQGTSSTTTTPATPPDFYTMVPPVIPQTATAGTDYGYRAGQINAATGISGHLKAFRVQADGNLATTASWDAADVIAKMDDTTRRGKMWTLDANNQFVTIANADAAGLGSSTAEHILNPASGTLAGRDPASLIGRPWKTAPIIVGKSVLFAADDGFLYSIDSTQGTLNWAWMPREVLPLTADPATLMSTHPWGQIATYSIGGKTYVTGSALAGALHFTLRVSTDGNALSGDAPVWQDYRSGKTSPSNPFGGDAPQMATLTEGSAAGKVAYIVDNRLVIRMLDNSGTVSDNTLSATATSNLFYYSDSEIYFGDSTHHIKQVNSSGTEQSSSGQQVTAPSNVDLSITDTIESVSGALVNNASGNSLVLLAQTPTRVSAIKRDPAGSWALAWSTAVGANDTAVPQIGSGMVITAPPMITRSKVLIPITLPGTTAFCQGDVGYNFGPLDLVSGQAAIDNIKFNGNSITTAQLTNQIGSGMATGIVLYTVVSSGTSTDVAYASTGTSGAPFTFGIAKTKTRLNWRELTTYF